MVLITDLGHNKVNIGGVVEKYKSVPIVEVLLCIDPLHGSWALLLLTLVQ